MKVAILGTRGIPNNYGGFEQLAEFLSVQLVERGHEVWVYNSSLHPYKKEIFKGVNIIACKDLEDKVGTFGQFIYDFNCIMDSRNRNFDTIIQLGYTSSSIWWFLLPRKSLIITNMDGLEWKRSKYNSGVKVFLKFAEWLAIKSSHKLVADSIGIQSYLEKKYKVESNFIPYGAYSFEAPVFNTLISYNVVPNSYYLLIARFEPENNIETIINGYIASNTSDPLLIVGSVNNKYAHYIMDKYNSDKIRYMGAIYSMEVLNNLRYYAKMYFHGHSVGGTNPSLLEAMASQVFICAHSNDFNKSVLQDDAVYFSNDTEITAIITSYIGREFKQKAINNNLKKIKEIYTWNNIVTAYEELLV